MPNSPKNHLAIFIESKQCKHSDPTRQLLDCIVNSKLRTQVETTAIRRTWTLSKNKNTNTQRLKENVRLHGTSQQLSKQL